jgi:hypothetical protein
LFGRQLSATVATGADWSPQLRHWLASSIPSRTSNEIELQTAANVMEAVQDLMQNDAQ